MRNSDCLIKKFLNVGLLFITFLLLSFNIFAITGETSGSNNDIWEIVWPESIDGENVSSKKLEKDDLIVIKVVSKARQTETYYRTVGWAIYTKNTFAPTNLPEDQYIIGSRDIHRSEKWGVVGSPLMDGSEFITTSSESVRNGFNYADFRMNKKDIYSAFMKKGTKFDKSMIQSDGKIKLYISGITGVPNQSSKKGVVILSPLC